MKNRKDTAMRMIKSAVTVLYMAMAAVGMTATAAHATLDDQGGGYSSIPLPVSNGWKSLRPWAFHITRRKPMPSSSPKGSGMPLRRR